ncbi:MAG: N-acetyltransferase [Rhodobacteraceae bacterium]|nr:N-acetyltransferase [Paracoccaceae bacterium]
MTLRAATAADVAALEVFLTARAAGSMFPLGNLRAHGLGHGQGGEDAHATRFWVADGPGGIVGTLGLTAGGMLLPQWPDGDWAQARGLLAGVPVEGAVGPADQVRPLLAALGIDRAPRRSDTDQPAFALDLSGLVVPDGPGDLHPLAAEDLPWLTDWRAAYAAEVQGASGPAARMRAGAEVRAWIAAGSHRGLRVAGQPVAICGFNARLPGIVQVGGVFTPPPLRGRGHARRAVALHLAEARTGGVVQAVLFAASDPAARAYVAIGFRRTGTVAVVLFDGPAAATRAGHTPA